MWVIHDPVNGYVVFNFESGRSKADAKPAVNYVACAAHVRRKFFDALKNDRVRAEHALVMFATMYTHEHKIRKYEPEARHAYRGKHLEPILQEFKNWLDEQSTQVTPKSAIGRAMTYAQNRYAGLKNVLKDGRLELDNNLIENKIRPLALGRKNYLFAGSDQGAQRLAMFYSFFGSCKALGVNPYRWLTKALEVMPRTRPSRYADLLPGNLDLEQ